MHQAHSDNIPYLYIQIQTQLSMKTLYKTIAATIILLFPLITESQNINTLAGIGIAGFSGDGGQATAAEMNGPGGVFVDKAGNVLIADQNNGSIRSVSPSGIITTIAGVGSNGFAGDGGPATAAELGAPELIWVDTATSNLFIADQSNERIRKVDAGGTITTVAGNGFGGYSGDGGQATDAELSVPIGVAFDKTGNMYIADYGTNHIRKVDPSGIITTFAGNGVGGYNGDGIQATAAELYNPSAAKADAAGNIYISEINNHRIRKVDPSGIITTVAGTGTGGYNGDGIAATSAELYDPFDVIIDGAGNLYIADFSNHRVREVNTSGIISTVAGIGFAGYSGDGGPATAAEINYPLAIYATPSGGLYIAEWGGHRVRYIAGVTTDISQSPTNENDLTIYPNPANSKIVITSPNNIEAIKVFDLTGKLLDKYRYGKQGEVTKQIDVSHYPNGIYFVKVLIDHKELTQKIVVSR